MAVIPKTPARRPRALRVLRIDDQSPEPDAIKSWFNAQEFWFRTTEGSEAPDIILCDINFELDSHSPLHHVHSKKPTGLLVRTTIPSIGPGERGSLSF